VTAKKLAPQRDRIPDYMRMLRGVETAMLKLPRFDPNCDEAFISFLAKKYVDVRHQHHWAESSMTTSQSAAAFADIRNLSERLLFRLNDLNGGAKDALDRCRDTSLNQMEFEPPSIDALRISLQWLSEAAHTVKPPPVEKRGPDQKRDAHMIAEFAAQDFNRLTWQAPTATARVNGDGYRAFLAEVLAALGMCDDSPESLARSGVQQWKQNGKHFLPRMEE
jgi:hypothetical protein